MEFSSKLLEKAVDEMSLLPGIGKRTALRLVLHLLKQPASQTENLARALSRLRNEIQLCASCHTICDTELCEICKNPKRNKKQICVVEDVKDVLAIEKTGQFQGIYHVLGGKISPLDGIGPHDLKIGSLIDKVKLGNIQELILALSTSIEGDTTNFYIYKQLQGLDIITTTIARGIGVNDELEYADEVTLGRSIAHRIPFGDAIRRN